ncbi:hypothetical protein WD019_15220 [Fictibacillus sp. Mic-4]|uniref:hypothetical protein n=1 Tax=Fictibacillus sp. Mic-4 TaxID=3132826 RepID=UPI003CEECBC6
MRRKTGVTIKDTNNMDQLTRNLERLNKKRIKVGVFGSDDSEIVMIARVHEFGTTIKPKNGQFLTVPVSPKAKGKRASDFPDLFRPAGTNVLAIPKGKNDFEVLFVLLKSVTIPERSFLRSGYDENIDYISKKIESMIDDVISGGIDPDVFANMIGMEFAGLIQKKLRSISEPPNSAATQAVKGSSNPLMDTGHLVGSIRHQVD